MIIIIGGLFYDKLDDRQSSYKIKPFNVKGVVGMWYWDGQPHQQLWPKMAKLMIWQELNLCKYKWYSNI